MKKRWYITISQVSKHPRRFSVRLRQDQRQKDAEPGEFQQDVDSLGPIRDLVRVLEPQRRADVVVGAEGLFRDRDVPPDETVDARIEAAIRDLRGSAGSVHLAVVFGDWDQMEARMKWWRESIQDLQLTDEELARLDPPKKWRPVQCPNDGAAFRLAVDLEVLPASLGWAAECPECGYAFIVRAE